MDCLDLAQDREQWRVDVNMVMNLGVLQNIGNFLSSFTTGSFTIRAQLHEVSLVSQLFLSSMTMSRLIGLLSKLTGIKIGPRHF
jgi:hypothetical protein